MNCHFERNDSEAFSPEPVEGEKSLWDASFRYATLILRFAQDDKQFFIPNFSNAKMCN
jgi:hypothetical protein